MIARPDERGDVVPQLLQIVSPDLEPPGLPPDPYDCSVRFEVVIGPKDGAGAEAFAFAVTTPAWLAHRPEPLWGRGHVVMAAFDWGLLKRSLAELLTRCSRGTWESTVAELRKYLDAVEEVDERPRLSM